VVVFQVQVYHWLDVSAYNWDIEQMESERENWVTNVLQ